jgi:hypothetical protein
MKQKPVDEGHVIEVVDNWWILAAVSLPLMAVTFFRWWALSQWMLLIDALRELRTRSAERLRVLASGKGSKRSLSDQGSLAGSTMVLGNVITRLSHY